MVGSHGPAASQRLDRFAASHGSLANGSTTNNQNTLHQSDTMNSYSRSLRSRRISGGSPGRGQTLQSPWRGEFHAELTDIEVGRLKLQRGQENLPRLAASGMLWQQGRVLLWPGNGRLPVVRGVQMRPGELLCLGLACSLITDIRTKHVCHADAGCVRSCRCRARSDRPRPCCHPRQGPAPAGAHVRVAGFSRRSCHPRQRHDADRVLVASGGQGLGTGAAATDDRVSSA